MNWHLNNIHHSKEMHKLYGILFSHVDRKTENHKNFHPFIGVFIGRKFSLFDSDVKFPLKILVQKLDQIYKTCSKNAHTTHYANEILKLIKKLDAEGEKALNESSKITQIIVRIRSWLASFFYDWKGTMDCLTLEIQSNLKKTTLEEISDILQKPETSQTNVHRHPLIPTC